MVRTAVVCPSSVVSLRTAEALCQHETGTVSGSAGFLRIQPSWPVQVTTSISKLAIEVFARQKGVAAFGNR
jgi:hypothetical protein